jgi:hypothetical protein
VLGAILLATFLLYAPSLANDFTWDDRHAAMGSGPSRHPLVATLHAPGHYFAANWWPQHAPAATAYRPLTTLWFALRHACCGDHAVIAHLLNVLLHTLTVALVFRLLRRLALPFGAAAAGAAVFGLHALHSEAVANLVGGAELLALAFGLGGTLVLLRAADARTGRGFAAWLALAGTCWFLAAAAKENGLAWIVLGPACLLARGLAVPAAACRDRARLGAIAASALAVAAVYLQLRAGMLARLPGGADASVGLLENPLLALSPLHRAASGMLAWGVGLAEVLLPHRLCCDHGPSRLPVVRELVGGLGAAAAAATLLFAGGIAASACAARRRPRLALAVVFFVVPSFALTNVPMAVFMHFAERSWTTPTVALALAVAGGLARVRGGRARRIALGAVGTWLVWSVATALPRNFVWADDATLVQREVASSPHSVRLQLCAGVMCLHRSDVAGAHRHFAAAAVLAPELPQPWIELARLEALRGERAHARAHLERARRSDPYEVARYRGVLRALQRRVDPPPALAASPPR